MVALKPGFRPGSSHARRGVSVLEMALVLPILLMLSFGVVDYGYFLYVKNTVQAAAQAGARAAIPSTANNATVTSAVSRMLTAAGLQNSGYQITFNPSNVGTAATGSPITITVTCSWGTVGLHALPVAMGGISNGKQVVGSAVMIKEPSGSSGGSNGGDGGGDNGNGNGGNGGGDGNRGGGDGGGNGGGDGGGGRGGG